MDKVIKYLNEKIENIEKKSFKNCNSIVYNFNNSND